MKKHIIYLIGFICLTSSAIAASISIIIEGEINRPDAYELREGSDIIDAVIVAKGFTRKADMDRVEVIRNGDKKVIYIRSMLKLSMRKEAYVPYMLKPGDRIVVREKEG
ncbi:periplasmic protein involved in polysaccharide export [Opitutaceae bacterium TAV1]|nr:periplasmic protein involved in polysaccharide export [Opitutaceae bacterium TAV1]